MHIRWTDYSLAQLRAHAVQTFRQGGGSRPDVLLIEINGEMAVLKDQNSADKWFALWLGRLLNWRECKALGKLADAACVPNVLSVPDKRAFLMSYHPSEPITRLTDTQVDWPDFFQRLNQAVAQIHRLGVAHNDLRNPTNILISPAGEPILVDFVGGFCRGKNWNVLNRWLFNKFSLVDQSAISKLKRRVAAHLMDDNDIQAQDIAGRSGMLARRIGQWFRKISRRLFTD